MNDTTIKIFGREYEVENLGVTKSEVEDLSGMLNRMMYKNARMLKDINPDRVSVLTAFSLLQENLHLRKKFMSGAVLNRI